MPTVESMTPVPVEKLDSAGRAVHYATSAKAALEQGVAALLDYINEAEQRALDAEERRAKAELEVADLEGLKRERDRLASDVVALRADADVETERLMSARRELAALKAKLG